GKPDLLLRHFGRSVRMHFELLLDARGFAGALTQIIELGTSHVAATLHFNARDQRGVGLKGTLHAFSRRDLAHDERRVQTAVTLRDDYAFVCLHALALPLHHVDIHDNRISRSKVGDVLSEPLDFFLLELLD